MSKSKKIIEVPIVAPTTKLSNIDIIDTPLLSVVKKTSFDMIMLCIPFIIAFGLLLLSTFSQSVTGFVFVFFFLIITIFRWLVMKIPNVNIKDNSYCNLGGLEFNSTYSLYALSFILFYLLVPMVQNSDVNWWACGTILLFLTIDILYRNSKKCYSAVTWSSIVMNTTGGMLLGILIPFILYGLDRPEWLYFNEMSSNKDVCYMPKKTQFKCNVYKNGELVTSTRA